MLSMPRPARPRPRPPRTWRDYTRGIDEPRQRVGVEVELKSTSIPFHSKDFDTHVRAGEFGLWAAEHGDRNVLRPRRIRRAVGGRRPAPLKGVGFHLDLGTDGRSALLELVTTPGSPEAVARNLSRVRDEVHAAGHKGFKRWLRNAFEPALTAPRHAPHYQYMRQHLEVGHGQLFPNLAQVTTTHTEPEMLRLRSFPEVMGDYRGNQSAPARLDRADVERSVKARRAAREAGKPLPLPATVRFLQGIRPYREHRQSKGTGALVKHAAEQFTPSGRRSIPGSTRMAALNDDLASPLAGLRTRANKLAPVHRRGGERAFVTEYRGRDAASAAVGSFLNDRHASSDTLAKALRSELYPLHAPRSRGRS